MWYYVHLCAQCRPCNTNWPVEADTAYHPLHVFVGLSCTPSSCLCGAMLLLQGVKKLHFCQPTVFGYASTIGCRSGSMLHQLGCVGVLLCLVRCLCFEDIHQQWHTSGPCGSTTDYILCWRGPSAVTCSSHRVLSVCLGVHVDCMLHWLDGLAVPSARVKWVRPVDWALGQPGAHLLLQQQSQQCRMLRG